MDSFLSEFEEANSAELRWLREVYQFVEDTLCPVTGQNTGYSAGQLALAVVKRVQRAAGTESALLPLAYRLISVSELVTRQHTLCCSHLTWTTNEYREWIKEADGRPSNHKALPLAYLLLIGCLTDEGSIESGGTCGGTWKVMDGSGSVPCEVLNPSPEWRGQLMLFPSWNYIPQHASGQGQKAEGYLELSASPLPLVPSPTAFDPGGSPSNLMGVREAAKLLRLRERRGGVRLHVCGQVCTVGPLLDIGVNSFFCFCLREGDSSVPVLVTDPGCLCWQQCVHVAMFVCLSGLRLHRLRGWLGHRVLCTTPQSRLQLLEEPLATLLTCEEVLGTTGKIVSETQGQQEAAMDSQTEPGTQTITSLPQTLPTVKTKISKMISYKGVVSSVLSSEAGLYEIDGKVGLCLAYHPLQRGGHALRPGAEIELHDVHFLYRPSPHAPPTVLCVCLRSSVRVVAFSRLDTGVTSRPTRDSPAHRLLLERNLGISQYLWLCHCLSALRERLCPRWVREEHVGAVARRLLSCLVPPGQEGSGPRELYKEMLEEPHCCPLTEYCVGRPSCELLSVRDLRSWMERECWDSMSLHSLLPPSAPHLTRAELNPCLPGLSTSCLPTLCPDPRGFVENSTAGQQLLQGETSDSQTGSLWIRHRATEQVLVGVLQPSGRGPCLRLQDQTGAVDCVVVETGHAHSYCAAYNTAWLGCLVCVQHYTLVMERFLTTDFPAWTHLDQERYITHRHSRVYIQFCLDDVLVLSLSSAMAKLRGASERGKSREGEGQKGKSAPDSSADGPGGCGEGIGGSEGPGHARREGEVDDGERPGQSVDRSHMQAIEEPVLSSLTANGSRPGLGKRRAKQEEDWRENYFKKARKDDKGDDLEPKTHTEIQGSTGSGERDTHKPPLNDPGQLKVTASDPCVSVVFRVESKEGLAFRNVQVSGDDPGLSLSFGVSAALLGGVQGWRQDPQNCPLEQRETVEGEAWDDRVELQFVGHCVRWYPFLQLGTAYRIVAPHTEDPGVLRGSSAPMQGGSAPGGVRPQGAPSLLVQPRWRLHTLPLPQENQHLEQKVMSVSEVLYSSTAPSLVTFEGVVSHRITLLEEKGKTPCVQSELRKKGVDVEQTLNVRLTVQDLASLGQNMQVYIDLSQKPYTPGLVPGAVVLFHTFHRKVSQVNCVYCRSVSLSCVTVTALGQAQSGSEELSTPSPIMHLGEWALDRHVGLGRVRGHVVCVLYLQLRWVCSLCTSVFKQDACTRNYPPCTSTIAVFQAEAKAAIEDSTGEAQVWFSPQTVSGLLALSVTEWEGLQRLVRVRGPLRMYHRGRSVVSDVDAEDSLLQYLSYLCCSAAVCRSVTLTCQRQPRGQSSAAHWHEDAQLKGFTRGDREFMTRIPAPLLLQCTELREWESSL
ncbi:hypothetical protein AAFF_G00156800 [Aldrovandia affinis]|uniref:CST complex subunit CTC1 n=1 Tax=Aldrovandia affinis TaxID=143900 RepID=A0AAD7RNW9_9TELE|nr:hypothetical protein AAFF_G00156800 [Aldrovandia affinis]